MPLSRCRAAISARIPASTKSGTNAPGPRTSGLVAPVPGLESLPVEADESGGMDVMVRPARLPRLLPPREREFRRDNAGVDAPERDLRDEAPDLVRVWWR